VNHADRDIETIIARLQIVCECGWLIRFDARCTGNRFLMRRAFSVYGVMTFSRIDISSLSRTLLQLLWDEEKVNVLDIGITDGTTCGTQFTYRGSRRTAFHLQVSPENVSRNRKYLFHFLKHRCNGWMKGQNVNCDKRMDKFCVQVKKTPTKWNDIM